MAGPQKAKKILSQGIGEFDAIIERKATAIAKAEQERIEKLRLEEAHRKIEAAQKLKDAETTESMQKAIDLETEAEDIIDMPIPKIQVERPDKLKGIRKLKIVKCEVTDEEKLKTYIVEQIMLGKIDYFRFLKINDSELRKYTKLKDGDVIMPGWNVWEEFKASSTGK